jgi:hypothetical protein
MVINRGLESSCFRLDPYEDHVRGLSCTRADLPGRSERQAGIALAIHRIFQRFIDGLLGASDVDALRDTIGVLRELWSCLLCVRLGIAGTDFPSIYPRTPRHGQITICGTSTSV